MQGSRLRGKTSQATLALRCRQTAYYHSHYTWTDARDFVGSWIGLMAAFDLESCKRVDNTLNCEGVSTSETWCNCHCCWTQFRLFCGTVPLNFVLRGPNGA